MKEYGNLIKFLFADIFLGVIKDNKIPVAIVSLLLVAVIVVGCVALPSDSSSDPVSSGGVSSELSSTGTSSIVSVSSDAPASSSVSSSKPVSSSERPTVSTYAQPEPNIFPPKNSNITPAAVKTYTSWNKNGTVFDYKTPMDMEDNVFMDSLIYTGYDVAKQRESELEHQVLTIGFQKSVTIMTAEQVVMKLMHKVCLIKISLSKTIWFVLPLSDMFIKTICQMR